MVFLLFALFFVLFTSRALGYDTGLAPGLSVKNAFLYLLFAAVTIDTAFTRRRKLELMPVFIPFSAYVLYAIFTWLLLSMVFDNPRYSPFVGFISLKSGPIDQLLVLLLLFYGINDTRRALTLLRSIVWLVCLGNVIALVDALGIVEIGMVRIEDGRIGGTIGNANEFAAFAGLFLPAIIAIYVTESGFKKALAGFAAFTSSIAFLMAVSRGAIVGLIGGSIIAAWYLRSIIPPKILARSAIVVVAFCVIVVVSALALGYGEVLQDRFGQMSGSAHYATSGRVTIWSKPLKIMLDNPLSFITGFGWNSYDSSLHFRLATHNTYLDTLYNLGVIGLALFLLTVVNVLRTARASIGHAGPVARAFLIAFIFGFLSLLVTIFFSNLYPTWLYVWAFVGITMRIAVSEIETARAPTAAWQKDASQRESGGAAPQRG